MVIHVHSWFLFHHSILGACKSWREEEDTVAGLDWMIDVFFFFAWTLSQTFRSSCLILTWYWWQLFQLWDGAGSCPVCSCLWFDSQQTLGTLCSSCQFLNPHERPKCYRCPPNSPVWQDPRKPQPLVQDKPKTEDSVPSISIERFYAGGWYGMLLHGNEVITAWYRSFLVVYGPLSSFMVKYDGSWSFMVLHSHSIVWDGAGSCSVCSCLWFASQQTLGTLCSSCQFLNPHERPKCYRCPPNSPVWQDPRKPQPLVQDKPKTEDSFSSISVKSAMLVDGMGCCCMVMRWWGHDKVHFWSSMVFYRYLWSSMMVHGHSWSFIVIL